MIKVNVTPAAVVDYKTSLLLFRYYAPYVLTNRTMSTLFVRELYPCHFCSYSYNFKLIVYNYTLIAEKLTGPAMKEKSLTMM